MKPTAHPILHRLPRRGALLLLALAACSGSDGPAAPPTDPDPVPTRIVVEPATVELVSLGDSTQLTATVLDEDDRPMPEVRVLWDSGADSVAQVSDAGWVRAVGNGDAVVQALTPNLTTDVAVQVRQRGVSVEPVVSSVALPWVGARWSVAVRVRDAGGSLLPDPVLELSVADSAVAAVEDGVLVARSAGSTAVQVTYQAADGPLVDTVAVTVTDSGEVGPRIDAVNPGVLDEGGQGEILGARFGGDPALNRIVLDGEPVEILSATADRLVFQVPSYPCRPIRAADLVLETFGEERARTAEVAPAGITRLAVGEAVVNPSCIQLDAAEAGAGAPRYAIGVLSTSTVTDVQGVRLLATPGQPGVATAAEDAGSPGAGSYRLSPIRAATASSGAFTLMDAATGGQDLDRALSGGAWDGAGALDWRDRHRAAELALRARESADIARIGRSVLTSGAGPQPTPDGPPVARQTTEGDSLVVGDYLQVRVPGSCDFYATTNGRVRLVTPSLIFLEDIRNPEPSDIDVEDLQAVADIYEAGVPSVLEENFGAMTDVDGNGRLLVLMTQEVNKLGEILGFVFGQDLYGRTQCRGSNEAEIMYIAVADTAGELGGLDLTIPQILDEMPGLLAHEATHVIQRGRQLLGPAGPKTTWELEGGATLMEQLGGFQVFGLGPGQDLGWTTLDTFRDGGWFDDWYSDLALYFGLPRDGGSVVADAPQACSWLARENNGPCVQFRAVYGTPATFMRMVMDRYGDAYPGGSEQLIRDVFSAQEFGVENFSRRVDVPVDRLLAEFSIALRADGLAGDWLTSWNLADVFGNLEPDARLRPIPVSGVELELATGVAGHSTAYFDWDPDGEHPPVALGLAAPEPGTGLPSEVFRLWVLRLQ